MARLRKIGIIFFGKLSAFAAGFVGLVAGITYSFGGLVYDILTTQSVNWGTALAFFALLGMPVIFGCAGFLAGAIAAPIYNLAAKRFGGIEIDIQQ
jgi:hypothetical protein